MVKTTPKDVFLHLLNILTFYLSIVSFITLYLQYISSLFPDQLNLYYTSMTSGVLRSSSILIIAFPVFLLTSWLLAREIKEIPAKRELGLRKWLTYFTLFVSAVTIIIDLITLVYNFLGGELTSRFFLKVLVILIVAAAVFGYHIWDLRRKELKPSKLPRNLAWALSFVVVASIVLSFFIVGTPQEQRNMRFDERRVSDLQNLQYQLLNYWMQKETLPQSLILLQDSISGFIVPKDPETNIEYKYQTKSALSFELCADFKTSTSDAGPVLGRAKVSSLASYPDDSFKQNWNHEKGETCFTRTIDPELYKPIK